MANIYYSRKLSDGTVKGSVGPFRNVNQAARAIGQAALDNGYVSTHAAADMLAMRFTWATPGPHVHSRSGVTYMIHTGSATPAALTDH